jgi:hypothetical protein
VGAPRAGGLAHPGPPDAPGAGAGCGGEDRSPAALWAPLYRVGGAGAAGLAGLTVAQAVVFSVVGSPGSVPEWFALFQTSAVRGLLAFELLMVVYAVVAVPVALALGAALWRATPALAALYVGLSLVASAAFVGARPAFEMLWLSGAHAAAGLEAERTMYLAAGQATLAAFHGTLFWTSYLLGSASGVVLAAAMLRGRRFGRAAPCLRVASSLLDLGLFVPAVGLLLSLLSVVCLLAFDVLVSVRLLALARDR